MNVHGQARLQESEKVIPALDRRGFVTAPEYGTVRDAGRRKRFAVREIVTREGLFEDDNALDTCISQLLGRWPGVERGDRDTALAMSIEPDIESPERTLRAAEPDLVLEC